MRFLADENIHKQVVVGLRAAGFDVEWVRDSAHGQSDEAILDRADINQLILITCDRDFGELVFKGNFPPPLAVLYSRIAHRKSALTVERLLQEIADGVALHQLTTLTEKHARRRPFPERRNQ